jgi:hypothetical protein
MTSEEAAQPAPPAPPEPKDPRTLILEFVLWAAHHDQFPLMRGDLKDNTAIPITLAAAVHLIAEYYETHLKPGVAEYIQAAKYPPLSDWEQFARDHPSPDPRDLTADVPQK